MKKLEIPLELKAFLTKGMQLDFEHQKSEVGRIKLVTIKQLKISFAEVKSWDTEYEDEDPYAELDGYYLIPAINLVIWSDLYEPEGILAWFPTFKSYGSFDNEHQTFLLFQHVTWNDILIDPVLYLDEQWKHSGVGSFKKPWPYHDYYYDDLDIKFAGYKFSCNIHKMQLIFADSHEDDLPDLATEKAIQFLRHSQKEFPYPGLVINDKEYFCPECKRISILEYKKLT